MSVWNYKCEETEKRLTRIWKIYVKYDDAGNKPRARYWRAIYDIELTEYRVRREIFHDSYGNVS